MHSWPGPRVAGMQAYQSTDQRGNFSEIGGRGATVTSGLCLKVGGQTWHGGDGNSPQVDVTLFAYWAFGNWLEHLKSPYCNPKQPYPVTPHFLQAPDNSEANLELLSRREWGMLCPRASVRKLSPWGFWTWLNVPIRPLLPAAAFPKVDEGKVKFSFMFPCVGWEFCQSWEHHSLRHRDTYFDVFHLGLE